MEKKYKYCLKEKKLVEYSEHDSNFSAKNGKEQEKIREIVFESDRCSVLTDTGAIYKEWNNFASNLPSKLLSLSLTQKNYKHVMDLLIETVKYSNQLSKELVRKNCNASDDVFENIDCVHEKIHNKLCDLNTHYKLKKDIKKNPFYVEPVEKAIGLKWKNAKVNPKTNIPDHGLTQSTFMYVPILRTLKSLFKDKDFEERYIRYNRHEKHKCEPGVYKDFCCGSVAKSIEIFDDPLAIQIQFGIDDFEVCCPVKTKAKIHKINATYMQIKNMPVEYRSKLDNIHLVALCGTLNFKSKDYDYNHIAELIFDEISKLETDGLKIQNECIKGAIINIACDNLGANFVAGFVECFVAHYFCRYCECERKECKTMVKEDKRKRRTKTKYANHLKIAEEGKAQNYDSSKGVKRYCKFNELNYFHILDNMAPDIMHDLNEGVILFCLHNFFKLVLQNTDLKLSDIQQRVRDFASYGPTYQYNKPSLLSVDKDNLNQNATQLYCLMVHLPFIFFDIKEKLMPFWEPVESLFKCMQIIYSPVITEREIKLLEKHIQQHLKAVIEIFKCTLIPKHHFLLHYPECIRKMGPLIHLWTMRLESKHKVLTEIGRKKMNFINLPKTLATAHQEMKCKPPALSTQVKPSESFGQFKNTMQYIRFESIIDRDIGKDVNDIRVHKLASYDNIEYREGSIIIKNNRIYEIKNVLSIDSKVYFICEMCKPLSFNTFCNSIHIENVNDSLIALAFDTLDDKVVYDKIYAGEMFFLIADKLHIAQLI